MPETTGRAARRVQDEESLNAAAAGEGRGDPGNKAAASANMAPVSSTLSRS